MLPKSKRIPRNLFVLFKNEAKTFRNGLFLLKLAKSLGGSKFCFSVSKKIAKSAVVRNRIRRSGYRQLSNFLSEIKENTMILFIFAKIPRDGFEIKQNLKEILKKSNLIK